VLEWQRAQQESKPPTAPKPLPLYFPERLPKLHNLACLIETLFDIFRALVHRIRIEQKYIPFKVNFEFAWLEAEVQKQFTSAIDGLTNIRAFMYFAIRNGTYYKEAVNKVGDVDGKIFWVLQ
jgi:hypothetical protein